MKRGLVALALTFMLAVPGVAMAFGEGAPMGLYLAPKFLMSFQNTGQVDRSGALSGFDITPHNEFTAGGAFAVGYDMWSQNSIPVRAELEVALRSNSKHEWESSKGNVKGTWNNSTIMGNVFYDFHNDTQFTPYVGAGLGVALNYAGYDIDNERGDHFSMSEHSTSFAWNAGAGAAYNFTDNFSIDAQYRFVGLGHTETRATVGGKRYEVDNSPYANEISVGLRFGF